MYMKVWGAQQDALSAYSSVLQAQQSVAPAVYPDAETDAENLHCCRGAKNRQELNAVLRRHIMLRRLKADVLGQIPALQRSRVSVLPDPVNLKVLLSARSNEPL